MFIRAKKSKSNRQDQSLEPNPSIQIMKRSVMSVPIAWFSDGKPSILRVKLSEMTHFFQVTFHIDQNPLHWSPYWTQEPGRYKRRRSPCCRRLRLLRSRPRRPLPWRRLYLRRWHTRSCRNRYQLCLRPLLHDLKMQVKKYSLSFTMLLKMNWVREEIMESSSFPSGFSFRSLSELKYVKITKRKGM